jgi:hypothetical protein
MEECEVVAVRAVRGEAALEIGAAALDQLCSKASGIRGLRARREANLDRIR